MTELTTEAPMHQRHSVQISWYRYNKLKRDSDFLRALHDVGVDNWEGYSYAAELMDEYED